MICSQAGSATHISPATDGRHGRLWTRSAVHRGDISPRSPSHLGLSRTLRHFALVCRKGAKNLALLLFRDVELVERAGKLSGDLVELFGRYPEPTVRFLETEHVVPGHGRRILKRSAGHVADP